ncbi:clostripain-related cysteine peptidase [Phocaeicola salanitronis]|uniref:clostripain-related cysteine peptidase n=1 Tax=Phocaeicola salanitronis TaxID=376805 RepID=UPI0023F67EB3|nr:clostripain-related cysteine peptidase [Phocaeicola salanitronis]
MKKLFLYIVSLFILVGCSDEIPEHERPVQSKRAILAYLIANNNLDTDIMNNVVWMYESLAQSQDSCSLAIYYKPSSSNAYINEAQILTFFTDGHGQINGQPVLEGSNITTGNVVEQALKYTAVPGIATDTEVMQANLQAMADIIPAESYGLIFGSHATSWMPAEENPFISTKSFGQDGSAYNSINIPEFADVLEASFPGNLDFVLFDACMMQTAEVCYELRNATHYCIASVMETPTVGFPYHRILSELYQDEIDFNQICTDVISFNKEMGLWGTYAVVDCTQMDAFANAVREQIDQHASALENLSLHSIQQYGVKNGSTDFSYFSFDVADFIKQLNEGELPVLFQQTLDQTVLAKSCITNSHSYPYGSILTDESKYCGIGMYIPDAVLDTRWNDYYRSAISWYQTVWSE